MRLALLALLAPALLATTLLASTALAAPDTFACAFDSTTRAGGEPRSDVNEIVFDLETKTIEFHAPDGDLTYDNASELGRRLVIGASQGNYSGAGDAEGHLFTYIFKRPVAEGGPHILSWAVFADGPEGGRSIWHCAPPGTALPISPPVSPTP